MKKILFVCLGNICRSPLAEAIFNDKIDKLGLQDSFKADSAGTGAYHIGEKPDERSVDVAKSHNIFIDHRGQLFEKYHVREFDYLIAMDSSNFYNIEKVIGAPSSKLFKMRDFDSKAKGADVPDPYYGGKDGFENIYQILDRSMDGFINFIRK